MLRPGLMLVSQGYGIGLPTLGGTIPDWSVNNLYPAASFTESGGTGPFTYAITSGALPTGLSLNTGTGAITGTPTAGGSFTFTLTVTDSLAQTGHITHTTAIAADANFASVSLLLHGEGTNGGTVFTDSETTPKTVTAVGSAVTSTANFKFGSSAIKLRSATNDWLTTPHATSLDLITSNPDFTTECWVFPLDRTNFRIIYDKDGTSGSSNPSWSLITMQTTGFLRAILGTGNGTSGLQTFLGVTAVPLNAWSHVAFCRKSTKGFVFLNGKLEVIATLSGAIADGGKALLIGQESGQSGLTWNGEIDEVRITKGVCRYDATGQSVGTQTFTPDPWPFPNG